jgi:hypothetical protein
MVPGTKPRARCQESTNNGQGRSNESRLQMTVQNRSRIEERVPAGRTQATGFWGHGWNDVLNSSSHICHLTSASQPPPTKRLPHKTAFFVEIGPALPIG